MNKKQKITLFSCLFVILAVIIVWLFSGAEVFTKTQVLIEKKDELFGTTYKEWQNKFVWGLDLTAIISTLIVLIGSLLFYLFRSKKITNEN